TIRKHLKDYCDKVTDDYETVIVTRKDEKNVVIISLEEYNAMQKTIKNTAYLSMIDKSMAELESGNLVSKSLEELAECE
ncbi:MAG: type II toxin-antitoxin system Phd/YefM family antitoxin, partial [Proteocatella sp.]